MCEQGEEAIACNLYEECLSLRPEVGEVWAIAHALYRLGQAAHKKGDLTAACTLLADALRVLHALGFKSAMPAVFMDIARIVVEQGKIESAVRIMGAARALEEALDPLQFSEKHNEHDAEIDAGRAALGDDAFSTARAEGRAMTLEQAVTYAVGIINTDPSSV